MVTSYFNYVSIDFLTQPSRVFITLLLNQ